MINSILDRENPWPSRKFLYCQLFDENGHCRIDHINRNETLNEDLEALCATFGRRFMPGPPKRVSPRKKDPRAYYTDGLYDLALKTYHREMTLFGYNGFGLQMDETNFDQGYLKKNSIKYEYLTDRLHVPVMSTPGENGGEPSSESLSPGND